MFKKITSFILTAFVFYALSLQNKDSCCSSDKTTISNNSCACCQPKKEIKSCCSHKKNTTKAICKCNHNIKTSLLPTAIKLEKKAVSNAFPKPVFSTIVEIHNQNAYKFKSWDTDPPPYIFVHINSLFQQKQLLTI